MKFLDILKISLHSIFHNKIRTLITVIIVFVVSLLIMVISIIGISFYTSINTAYVDLYKKTGAHFNLESYSKNTKTESVWRSISSEEYDIMMKELNTCPEIVDNIEVNAGYLDTFYLYDVDSRPSSAQLEELYYNNTFFHKYGDYRPDVSIISVWGDLDPKSKGISYLKTGKLWTREDEGAKKVWVSENFITQAVNYGYYLEVGDYIVLSFISNTYSNEISTMKFHAEKFRISGILLNSALAELNQERDVFMDIKTAYDVMQESLNVNNISVVNEPRIGFVFENEYKKLNGVVKNINAAIDPSGYNNKKIERFKCDIVEQLKTVRIIGAVMIGAAVFICTMILVISIGSVANSIIISVDKNKRFLGVMMAVGLRTGGVKRIVQYEALIIIMLATGLAFGLLKLFQRYFMPVIDFLMSLPGFTDSSIVVLPFYIPLITIVGFIAMALLFARKSLTKIINMDVISVISEVA